MNDMIRHVIVTEKPPAKTVRRLIMTGADFDGDRSVVILTRGMMKKLMRSNRNLKFLAGFSFAIAVAVKIGQSKLDEELYRLSVRLGKLERGEEE